MGKKLLSTVDIALMISRAQSLSREESKIAVWFFRKSLQKALISQAS
jgi:hypothetical protein